MDNIPHFEAIQYEALEQSYSIVSFIGALIQVLLFCGSFLAAIFFFPDFKYYPHIAGICFPFLLLSLYYPFKAYSYMGIAVREHDIAFKEGVVWRSEYVLAFNRIQHIEVSQGPLERKFNLAELKLYSAGGFSADLTISGLSHEKANQIQQWIQTYKQTHEFDRS